ncbi:SurA N-terminal domain-containing protein [Streptomyces carpaticus]|uniref:SurA N-terminal domain-containing protein n=1 Tax=Streptomyces harbinensis TaxID=1176198 RepID=A0A1I6VAP5_9ACTN|nr:SurA N-terminal domain-containing protein [Streptomyces harbinensis]QKV69418.1 SurA N-terminal domain-containing protein [Streptomyces harbinensis]UWM49446.1 SurA N-terminal domain-containing protein [Streptomyces carpaticus]SFT10737.1 SurA N-terminal domain-containing protein [Streptomyces harbinensis]
MKRRTTALSVTAAAVLVAAPLLTGCSTGAHPGAAAVVGGERISISQVQGHVDAVRAAQRDQPDADQLIAASSTLTRETVNFLVYLQVVDRAAQSQGVDITRRQVQEARADAEANAGGPDALAQSAISGQGGLPLTAEQIDDVLRSNLQIQGIAERLGVLEDPMGGEKIGQLLAETADEAGVEINPRYGTWDAQLVSLVDLDEPWLRTTDRDQQPVTLDG